MKSDSKLNKVIADARLARDSREQGYRARALKMYPHICGRCARDFNRENLHELTVHHRNHNHDDNPQDGSNWELLCVYCHDNEHQRQLEAARQGSAADPMEASVGTHNPFSNLRAMLSNKKKQP